MNKKIFRTVYFLFAFLFAGKLYSQNNLWYFTRGLATDEVAWAVDTDSAGNIYWAVEEKNQWPFWYFDIFLFKIDSNGQQVWQSSPWDSPYHFNDIAFKATVSGNDVYLSGRTDSTGNPVSGDALVTSYNISNGSFNWAYIFNPVPDYGYEEIDGLIVQPDGIYLSGFVTAPNDTMDFLIQKIDLSGQLVWSNTWGTSNWDGANGHMAMDNNYLYIAGSYNGDTLLFGTTPVNAGGVLACFSRNNGAYQWHVNWGGSPYYTDALGMEMSSDSMLYIVGFTGSLSLGIGSQSYLNKYSRTGQLKWSRVWGGSGTEDSRSLVTDADSIIYVVGATSSYGNGAKDIFVLKYDSAGTLIDSLFWGGAYDETAKDVAFYNGYLYITGETKSYGNGLINGDYKTDGLLLKIHGRTMQAPDSLTTSVFEENFSDENIFVYPNPANGEFNVRCFTFNTEKTDIKIYDITGKEMKIEFTKTKNEFSVQRGNLKKGIYLVKLQDISGSKTTILQIID